MIRVNRRTTFLNDPRRSGPPIVKDLANMGSLLGIHLPTIVARPGRVERNFVERVQTAYVRKGWKADMPLTIESAPLVAQERP